MIEQLDKGGLQATNWWVITGAPSSGKSSVLNALTYYYGYFVMPEAARVVIDQGISEGHSLEQIRASERDFQRMIFATKQEAELRTPPGKLVIWDRSAILDSVAYNLHSTASAEERDFDYSQEDEDTFVETFRYRGVFIMNRLPVERDYARTEDDRRADQIDQLLDLTHQAMGYDVIRVPIMPVSQRAEFIDSCIRLQPPLPGVFLGKSYFKQELFIPCSA